MMSMTMIMTMMLIGTTTMSTCVAVDHDGPYGESAMMMWMFAIATLLTTLLKAPMV